MPSCVTRWWTLWNIFGQIALHCSNHLVDEHDHLYCSTTLPYLIFSKFKHTFCFVFLVMPLPLPLPVGAVPELPLPGPVKVVKVFEATLRFRPGRVEDKPAALLHLVVNNNNDSDDNDKNKQERLTWSNLLDIPTKKELVGRPSHSKCSSGSDSKVALSHFSPTSLK